MSYQVLARKWRPANFTQVVGQQHVLTALINALDHNRLHHAYLFSGSRGVGKTTIARILAKSLNCEQGISSQPCEQCNTCKEINQGNYIDLLEIDAASRTKVEDTRELLDNVQYKPSRGRFKVYLIDEVHMLSRHSFNALLKTLEEPPEYVKFLLATTDPQKLPITVLSRCLQFHLKNHSIDEIEQQLQTILTDEHFSFDTGSLHAIAKAAQGSMRDALSLTEQAIAHCNGQLQAGPIHQMLGTLDQHQVAGLLQAVIAADANAVMEQLRQLLSLGADSEQVHVELASLLHQIAMYQLLPSSLNPNRMAPEQIQTLAAQASAEDIQLYYQLVLTGRQELPFAPEPRTGLEMTLLRMLAFRPVAPVSLQQLPALPSAVNLPVEPTIEAPTIDASTIEAPATEVPTVAVPPVISPAATPGQPVRTEPVTPAIKTPVESPGQEEQRPEQNTEDNDEPPAALLDEQNEILQEAEELGLNINDTDATREPVMAPSTETETKAEHDPQVDKPDTEETDLVQSARGARNFLRSHRQQRQQRDSGESVKKTPPVERIKPQPAARPVPAIPAEMPVFTAPVKTSPDLPPLSAYDDGMPSDESNDRPPWEAEPTPQAQQTQAPPLRRRPEARTLPSETLADIPAAQMTIAATPKTLSGSGRAILHLRDPDDPWCQMINQMQLSGRARQVALNALYEPQTHQLMVKPDSRHLCSKIVIDQLSEEIGRLETTVISLSVEFTNDNSRQTPAEIESAISARLLQQAKDAIYSDHNIQFLQQRFGAFVDDDSIEPIASPELQDGH